MNTSSLRIFLVIGLLMTSLGGKVECGPIAGAACVQACIVETASACVGISFAGPCKFLCPMLCAVISSVVV